MPEELASLLANPPSKDPRSDMEARIARASKALAAADLTRRERQVVELTAPRTHVR